MFVPDLTPKECIRRGIFGGCYFNPKGGKAGIVGSKVNIDHREFPPDWFANIPRNMYASRRYNADVNMYKVVAGTNQAFWETKGWIRTQDPRGWFQWYCRYYQGRRSEDDERQIARWKGVKSRWSAYLARRISAKYGTNPTKQQLDDASISPKVRQTLLHWACTMDMESFQTYKK
jgi:hypothetical protein